LPQNRPPIKQLEQVTRMTLAQNELSKQRKSSQKDASTTAKTNNDREKEFELLEEMAEKSQTNMPEDLVVEELNKKHAIIHTDQFYILTEKQHAFMKGSIDFVLESKASLKNQYENKLITCSDGRTKTKAEIWLKSPKRKEYLGITFDPTNKSNNTLYNIWRGYSVEQVKGNCQRFWDHVRLVICNGNQTYYEYIRKWLASLIQKPNEIATGLVLMGKQGIGKGAFVQPIGHLLGIHFVHLDNLERLLGNFNYHLKNAVLIYGDEAIWGGNKKELGKLKAMVTEEFAIIEPKGKDSIVIRNYRHLILSSNEDWPVHLDRDDRRFLILQVSDKHKEDIPYFKALDNEMKNGGYEALLYDLLNEDISNFDARRLPQNDEAFEVKLESAPRTEEYIYKVLKAGSFDIGKASSSGKWPKDISTTVVYNDYKDWCEYQDLKPERQEALGKSLKKLIHSTHKYQKRLDDGSRPPYYELPTLEKARSEFQKSYKVSGNIWNED
jgi:phage/plasmid-associated DNA primase